MNVLEHVYQATPFVVPASHSGDAYASVNQLLAMGYLKSDGATPPGVLWASEQLFNPVTRELTDSYTLRVDGSYQHTGYSGYVLGKPTQIVSSNAPEIDSTYSTATGLLLSSSSNGTTTKYAYSGDQIPGTGIIDEDDGINIPARFYTGAPGTLLATYRGSGLSVTFLTRNTYYDNSTAAGAVTNMLESSTDETSGLTTLYRYNSDGTTSSVSTTWAGLSAPVQQSATTYDSLGRELSSTDANGKTTTTSYDLDGKVTDTTDIYNGVTHNVYNAMGQLIQTIYPDGTETRSTYDAQGRVLWQSDRYYTNATSASYNPASADNTTTALATFTQYDAQTQVKNMPVFYVYKTGTGATPEIWDNDAKAMAGGIYTKGGASAPDALTYFPKINDRNRPAALSWAKSKGIVAGSGQSLDEYPFASTVQGGSLSPWLRVEPVDIAEQEMQKDALRAFYATQSFRPFNFLVVLVP